MTSFSKNTIKKISFDNTNCINHIKSSGYDWWISAVTGEFLAIVPKKFDVESFMKFVPASAKEQTIKITADIDFIRAIKNEILNLNPIV